ncbi:MAG: WG repeat-containing protein, partial [bacterium]|nr:WG repeat-containing protein [bacterium]
MKLTCCAFLLLAVAAQHPVPFEQGDRWGYKDSGGRVVIPSSFRLAEPFSAEGLAAVLDERGWAYINPSGRVVIRPLVVDNGPDYFREDLARFRRGGKVGFFNRRGQVALQPAYDFALPFSEGLTAVCQGCREVPAGEHTALQGGKWGYINRRGS